MARRHALLVLVGVAVLLSLASGMTVSSPVLPTPAVVTPRPSLPTPEPASILRIGVPGRVFSLDPLLATTPAEQLASSLLFRGLTRLGPNGSLVPDVARDWAVSGDGLTITFDLRTDVHWHDGPLVDADDVLFTVGLLQDPASGGASAPDWKQVSVERIDRFTVRFHLPQPLAGFLPLTTQPLLPSHLLAGVPFGHWNALPLAASGIGDGYFRLASATDVVLQLERAGPPLGGVRATWAPGQPEPESTPYAAGEPRPPLDGISIVLQADSASLATAYASGTVDLAVGMAPADAAALAARSGGHLIVDPTTTAAVLIPNLRFANRPLSSVTVRQALSEAIDRRSDAAALAGGAAQPVITPFPPSWPGWDAAASGVPTFDLAAAAAGLRAAGWTRVSSGWLRPGDSVPASIELLTPDTATDPALPALAEQVAADWRRLGLVVNVVALPLDQLVSARMESGNFDVALLNVDVGLEPDLYPLLVSTQAQVGGTNLSGFESSGLDSLLVAVRGGTNPLLRSQQSTVLQATLRRLLPLVPVWFSDQVAVASDRLTGPSSRLVRDLGDLQWDVLAWRFASGPAE